MEICCLARIPYHSVSFDLGDRPLVRAYGSNRQPNITISLALLSILTISNILQAVCGTCIG